MRYHFWMLCVASDAGSLGLAWAPERLGSTSGRLGAALGHSKDQLGSAPERLGHSKEQLSSPNCDNTLGPKKLERIFSAWAGLGWLGLALGWLGAGLGWLELLYLTAIRNRVPEDFACFALRSPAERILAAKPRNSHTFRMSFDFWVR